MNEKLFRAIKLLEKERGIPAEFIYEKIKDALVKSAKKALGYTERELSLPEHFERAEGKTVLVRTREKVNDKNDFKGELVFGDDEAVTIKTDDGEQLTFQRENVSAVKLADNIFCDLNPEEKTMRVFRKMEVVSEVEDTRTQLSVDEALIFDPNAIAGGTVEIDIDPKTVSRVFAQNARSVLRQGIREAESERSKREFQDNNQEVVTAVVQYVDPETGDAKILIGRSGATLFKNDQLPGEVLVPDKEIKVFVSVVQDERNTAYANISRKHPGLVKRLFEREVPEVSDGTVEIVSVSREAGSRTKIAVASREDNVDAVGACIGPRGQRVNSVIDSLCGEKIDIVRFSESPEEYIAAALAPAAVTSVSVEPSGAKSCHVVVPDNQLSLAIGNKGQNVRLAARLTGWKIDIMAQSAAE